jgi:hypothetical protein
MNSNAMVHSFLVAAFIASPGLSAAQNLLSSGDPIELAALPLVGYEADDNAYADGMRAINNGHWSDAIAIFSRVAAQGGGHADGALYWKAYAENKQGQGGTALETCSALRHDHPSSNWIEDCGALEIEIHAKNGQPVQPKTEQSDDLKLLALASLMQHDEKGALQQIDEILNGDSSEKLKQGALFIMGEHHTDTVYPQIARISFADGDVRIERGGDKHRKDVTWEAASANVPLEAGYSLVTGDGRAEIELEDASTLYLAPNSVLTINDLSTTAGVPHTDLALLSGTVTLHVHPYVAGETFILRTPTDNIVARYPQMAFFRVTSYTDGMAFTPMGGTLGIEGAGSQELTAGKTLYFKDGRRIVEAGPIHPPEFTSWDHWVADRTAARAVATANTLEASGLSTPIPGLADLEGQGHFFPCEPYGTCWEPSPGTENRQAAGNAQTALSPEQSELAARADSEPSAQTPAAGRNIRFIGPPAASGPSPQYSNLDAFFPCMPGDVRAMYRYGVLPAAAQYSMQPWAWAVCHSGSWIYRGNHYVWVAGHRHHHPCVHWIKSGRTVAFVPIHPRDVKDHLPVNRKAPVFALNPKDNHLVERVAFGNTHPIELLKEPPKEFRNEVPMPLPHVAEPHMEGHSIRDTFVAKGVGPRPTGIPITFDHHSQNFMMQQSHSIQGGRTVTGFAPISNHGGDLQSHSGAFNGSGGLHGGYSGGASGGSFHGGGSSASSDGGASHSGGGGGGNVSSSSASSGASSAAASASSGGGSHK